MTVRDRTKAKSANNDGVDVEGSGSKPGQQKRPEAGQFRLQVDRQTKTSFATYAAAEEAALAVKRGHPILYVTVFDAVAGVNTVIDLPGQPSNS